MTGDIVDGIDDIVGLYRLREKVLAHQINFVTERSEPQVTDGRDGDKKSQGHGKANRQTNANFEIFEHENTPDLITEKL